MADDEPTVTSSQPLYIHRPIPRRNWSAQSNISQQSYTSNNPNPNQHDGHLSASGLQPPFDPYSHSSEQPLAQYHSHTHSPTVNRSASSNDFLAQLNARLLRTSRGLSSDFQHDAQYNGDNQPSRTKSFLNMTSTLFGIYDDVSASGTETDVEPDTPWGVGAETPARGSSDEGRPLRWENGNGLGSPDAGLSMKRRERIGSVTQGRARGVDSAGMTSPLAPSGGHRWQYPRVQRGSTTSIVVLLAKFVALFLFGVTYGAVVSLAHDTRQLASVVRGQGGGMDHATWTYFVAWGVAGCVLGGLLPWVDGWWEAHSTAADRDGKSKLKAVKEEEAGFVERWTEVLRSVGAFFGIAFAIRRLPWQSTLQLTLTLALVNPALWYILDRSKSGFTFSLLLTSLMTSVIFLSNPGVLPSPPHLPALSNASGAPTPTPTLAGNGGIEGRMGIGGGAGGAGAAGVDGRDLFVGMVSYESLAVATWVGSVLFCSCICFGSVGRRLGV